MKETIQLSRFEYAVSLNEAELSKKIDLSDTRRNIIYPSRADRRKKPFNWIRIRSFFIKHKKFKRMMEFSCHPGGVHLLRLAMFYSENGCNMCRVYVEKNLF